MHCRIIYRTYIAQDTHTHTSHFYSHFLSFHKWYRHHIFFYFFLPKREECTFKFAKFSVENPAAAATFCFGSIVMIIIVASCVSVCVLALPYQFDTTTIFCRSLLPQLLLLTYARLPLFSPSNRPSARAFFLLSSSSLHGFVRSHWMSIKKICMWAHTWWCPSTFHYVRARVCVCVYVYYAYLSNYNMK